MVSKANSTKGSTQAIDYILNDKGQAVELARNGLAGSNGKEILEELRFFQQTNLNCTNNTISIVISPSAEQSQKLSFKDLEGVLQSHLKNLGLEENQYIATVHNSTKTQHIHIIANRIDSRGNALNDSFLSKKAQASAERIAKERGWKTANEVNTEKKENLREQTKQLREKIETLIRKDRPRNAEEFLRSLETGGLRTEISKSNSGKLNGYKVEGFKASDISRDITFLRLEATLNEYNREQKIESSKGFSR